MRRSTTRKANPDDRAAVARWMDADPTYRVGVDARTRRAVMEYAEHGRLVTSYPHAIGSYAQGIYEDYRRSLGRRINPSGRSTLGKRWYPSDLPRVGQTVTFKAPSDFRGWAEGVVTSLDVPRHAPPWILPVKDPPWVSIRCGSAEYEVPPSWVRWER